MALYEIVLRRPGHADEVQLTDHDDADIGEIRIYRGQRWRVVDIVEGESERVVKRLVCERIN